MPKHNLTMVGLPLAGKTQATNNLGDAMTTTETATESTATEEGRVVAPKNVAELKALTSVKTTEASDSFAKFMNENLANAEGYTPITSEQAWSLIYTHRVWQSSEERTAEKAALAEAKAAAAAAKKEANAKKAEERRIAKEAEDKAKAERKAAAEAEKARKAEAGENDDSDLAEGDDEVPAKPKRTRRAPAKAAATAGEF